MTLCERKASVHFPSAADRLSDRIRGSSDKTKNCPLRHASPAKTHFTDVFTGKDIPRQTASAVIILKILPLHYSCLATAFSRSLFRITKKVTMCAVRVTIHVIG